MFKVLCAGSDSAFGGGFNSSFVVEKVVDGAKKRLLLDVGFTTAEALKARGLGWKDIDAAFISHIHNDHCVGLADAGLFWRYVLSGSPKLTLFISTMEMLGDLRSILEPSLRVSSNADRPLTLEDYFNITVVEDGVFFWEGIKFQTIELDHVVNSVGGAGMKSYGLFFGEADSGPKVLFTSDFANPEQLFSWYGYAELILHDCEFGKSGVHPNFDTLSVLPFATRGKMWLYHCGYDGAKLELVRRNHFAGLARPGRSWLIGPTSIKVDDFEDSRGQQPVGANKHWLSFCGLFGRSCPICGSKLERTDADFYHNGELIGEKGKICPNFHQLTYRTARNGGKKIRH